MTDKPAREEVLSFDSSYITKSPCRNCPQKVRLPECSHDCETLIQLQRILSETISCSNDISEFETYFISTRN